VLHAYHAGAGNVHCVINQLNPTNGGVDLFKQIWQTECGRFKNESQNYSQIALASLSSFYAIINLDRDTVFLVQGDKFLKNYHRKSLKPWEAYNFLTKSLFAYETDLVDGTIPYDQFIRRISAIRKEFLFLAQHIAGDENKISLNLYPASENHVDELATRLIRYQRFDEAIKLLKMNIEMHPASVEAYTSLAKAYSSSGNKQLAAIYSNRSVALSKKEGLKGSD
jgi:tetratricopeptide (TPR) repeat protein